MKNLVIVALFALFCAVAVGCVNWSAWAPEQKAELACNVSVDLVKPECLRLDEDKQGTCEVAFEAVRTACIVAIKKDATSVCSFVQESVSTCVDAFEDPLNVSSCQRAFTAAYGVCLLSVPPAPVEASAAVE